MVLVAVPVQAAPGTVSFETDVRPILKAYCFECHGEGEKLRGGLDLRLAKFLRKGGDSGPAIAAGKPDESLLLERLRSGAMPPGKKKLTAAQVETIRTWVAAGAPVGRPEPDSLAAGFQITAEDRSYWAFQPVVRPAVPVTQPGEVIRNPVDAFLLAGLRARGLGFNPEASSRILVRRLYFDLIGLPPTPEQVESFVADNRPDAYERLVERLLASPAYGERWARHWLDVAGYADSEGYAIEDTVRADAWKYRDYVVRSFNADKPFDRFVQEQLAGDEMLTPPYRNLSPEDLDKLIATGFLRLAPDGTGSGNVDQKLARNQVIGDTLKIVSASLLGLTVGCAQCHNHRYDPIPQTDYYRLRALFEPAYDVKNWRPPAARRVSLYTDADRAAAAAIEKEAAAVDAERTKKQEKFINETFEKQLAKVPEAAREAVRSAWSTPEAKRTADQQKLLQEHPSANVTAGSLYLYDANAAAELTKMVKEATALRARKPVEEFVRALTEVPGQVPVTHLLHRGDPDQPKQAVAPGGLILLDERLPLAVPEKASPTTGRRLALARWLTDPRHPLTARVLVNRIWMHHFGRGLVGTPADFGRLGEKPSYPELLDWLASEFVGRGWSLKHLHRLLVTSAAYRQSSLRTADKDRLDPDNRLLGRMALRRLDAESVRDAILAVSGNLTTRLYGAPVPVKENEVGQFVLGIDTKDGAGAFGAEIPLPVGDAFRRSLYVQVRRSRPLAVLDTFDWALVEPCCEKRNSSTVTPQALLMMNSEFLLAQAATFAERARLEGGPEVPGQVARAWRLAFGVDASEKEVAEGVRFVTEQVALFQATPKKDGKTPQQQALAVFCQALLSANRFLYVE
jgi:hypothetical protein